MPVTISRAKLANLIHLLRLYVGYTAVTFLLAVHVKAVAVGDVFVDLSINQYSFNKS